MKPESRLRSQIIDHIRYYYRDAFIFHAYGSAYTPVGIPDLIICIDGLFFGLEIKMPGKEATEAQIFIGGRIQRAGGRWACVSSPKEALEFLEKCLEKSDANP